MPDLATVQRLLADTVRGMPRDAALLDLIPAMGLSAERRLAVYRNHHRISLVGALGTTFAVTRARIGADLFDRVAAGYVAACPPQEPRLSHFGAGLPQALAQGTRIGVPDWAADLAQLDWALHACWGAPDARPLALDHLASLPTDALSALVLEGLASCRLLHLAFDVGPAWRDAEAPPPPATPTHILVFRDQDGDTAFEVLQPAIARFLAALLAGAALGPAAEDAAADPEFDLAVSLALACARGLFAAPAHPESPIHA
ncbi:HvfC/BufC family peptide modification chaperone [Zavarzinia sp. CC-PAN008]|uniref:HvfC/BufC family peptide modification chaperone n=1 Tax=Zavarzinia sp. CC-PAN008 TaxID=3243332 RepID=UPI003F748EA7